MLIDSTTVSICEGNEVLIHNNSVNADSCIWEWKDGTATRSTCTSSQTHTYNFTSQFICNNITQNGTVNYYVLLTAKIGCNSHTNESPVSVRPRPRANFTAPYPICITGDSVQVTFNSTSCPSYSTGRAAVTYFWKFGDGTTSTQRNPVHYYHRSGNYNVTLIVTNTPTNPIYPSCGEDSITKAICVDTMPKAEFNLNIPDSCAGLSGISVPTIAGPSPRRRQRAAPLAAPRVQPLRPEPAAGPRRRPGRPGRAAGAPGLPAGRGAGAADRRGGPPRLSAAGPAGDYLARHSRRWLSRSRVRNLGRGFPAWDLVPALEALDRLPSARFAGDRLVAFDAAAAREEFLSLLEG